MIAAIAHCMHRARCRVACTSSDRAGSERNCADSAPHNASAAAVRAAQGAALTAARAASAALSFTKLRAWSGRADDDQRSECVVCLGDFALSDMERRVLGNCGHTICVQCFEQMERSAATSNIQRRDTAGAPPVLCPVCREPAAPDPRAWLAYQTDSLRGRTYFHHLDSGESSWERPRGSAAFWQRFVRPKQTECDKAAQQTDDTRQELDLCEYSSPKLGSLPRPESFYINLATGECVSSRPKEMISTIFADSCGGSGADPNLGPHSRHLRKQGHATDASHVSKRGAVICSVQSVPIRNNNNRF